MRRIRRIGRLSRHPPPPPPVILSEAKNLPQAKHLAAAWGELSTDYLERIERMRPIPESADSALIPSQ